MAEPDVVELTISDVREKLSDAINRVSYGNQRVYITRHGGRVAAVVSAEDADLLGELRKQGVPQLLTRTASGMEPDQCASLLANAVSEMFEVVSIDAKRRDDHREMVERLNRPGVVYVNTGPWAKLHRAGTRCAGPVPTFDDYVHGAMEMAGYDYQGAKATRLDFCKLCCRQEAGQA